MTDAIKTTSTTPFDNLSALRLDQSYADIVGVKKLLTAVPVRKPNRQEFVCVHPDPAYRLTFVRGQEVDCVRVRAAG
jgi:hypothetical protein